MKTLLMLLAVVSLSGCLDDQPKFPDHVKLEYVVFIGADGLADCGRCEILSYMPYQIGNCQGVHPSECNGVSGYKAKERADVIAWSQKNYNWEQDHCK